MLPICFVAAAVDEVSAEDAVAFAYERVGSASFVNAEIGVKVVCDGVPGRSVPNPSAPFSRSMSACGAGEANTSVVLRAFRCGGWAIWSATKEQPRQPWSGQPNTSGSKKAR